MGPARWMLVAPVLLGLFLYPRRRLALPAQLGRTREQACQSVQRVEVGSTPLSARPSPA